MCNVVTKLRCSRIAICCAAVFLCASIFADPPATRPANAIATWFGDLANRDPAVREKARSNLMGLKRDDLRALRNVVKESRPLAPSQAIVLRDVVMHVFLTGEAYAGNRRSGFLGVQLVSNFPVGDGTEPPEPGVVVVHRMPGVCAVRALQDAAMRLGVA